MIYNKRSNSQIVYHIVLFMLRVKKNLKTKILILTSILYISLYYIAIHILFLYPNSDNYDHQLD